MYSCKSPGLLVVCQLQKPTSIIIIITRGIISHLVSNVSLLCKQLAILIMEERHAGQWRFDICITKRIDARTTFSKAIQAGDRSASCFQHWVSLLWPDNPYWSHTYILPSSPDMAGKGGIFPSGLDANVCPVQLLPFSKQAFTRHLLVRHEVDSFPHWC